MKKILLIIIAIIGLLVLYKAQHVKPVEDPKESPIFQQRLQSSLDKFQESDYPSKAERQQRKNAEAGSRASSGTEQQVKDLVVSGMCGQVTLTWVEEKKVPKEKVIIKRREPDADYEPLQGTNIIEREEAEGVRYWFSESGLRDGVKYVYLVSLQDEGVKARVKGPVTITLACTERDRELLAQREKMLKEYYQKKGLEAKDSPAEKPFPPAPPAGGDVIASGRCGRLTLTWAETGMIDKSGIQIKRKSGNGDYMLLRVRNVYHREEETGGIRYWAADEGLRDGESYQYLVAFKDEMGKEVVKGPVSISLSCTEKDREMIAEQEKMVKEYYRKQSGRDKAAPGAPAAAAGASPYELSKEVYTVELGSSPWKGAQEAPVTLVVFSDFECVHCGTLAKTLETMLKTFPGDIKVVFKNYIIPYHKNSEYAAMAALAAGEQGKFWEMHDLLFKNQTALGKEAIISHARSLKLDLERFEKSLASQEIRSTIDQDTAQGKTLNIQNLPTTFINGRSFMGSPPADYIKGLIEEMLKKG